MHHQTDTPDSFLSKRHAKIASGKTKNIYAVYDRPDLVIMENNNSITKNDDPSATKQMASKAKTATKTTCNVFELLKQLGIPVAYKMQLSETEFLSKKCQMIPLEVIIRRYAVGSFLKRRPDLSSDPKNPFHFEKLIFELFLKTTGKEIKDLDGFVVGTIPDEDPFIENPYSNTEYWLLRHSKLPANSLENFNINIEKELFIENIETISKIEEITRKTFLVLEKAWDNLGYKLIDFKIEFGLSEDGELLIADVIDNDSWRLRDKEWNELSKQNFRDNVPLDVIADKYSMVASLTDNFSSQNLIEILSYMDEKYYNESIHI